MKKIPKSLRLKDENLRQKTDNRFFLWCDLYGLDGRGLCRECMNSLVCDKWKVLITRRLRISEYHNNPLYCPYKIYFGSHSRQGRDELKEIKKEMVSKYLWNKLT